MKHGKKERERSLIRAGEVVQLPQEALNFVLSCEEIYSGNMFSMMHNIGLTCAHD